MQPQPQVHYYSGLGAPAEASTRPPHCSESPDFGALQQMLTDLGYYQGPISGILDGPTQQALNLFVRDSGVPWVGHIDRGFCEFIVNKWETEVGQAGPPAEPAAAPSSLLFAPPVQLYQPTAVPFDDGRSLVEPQPGGGPPWDEPKAQLTRYAPYVIGGVIVVGAVGALVWYLKRKG